jgi:ATP-dependent Lon protease
MSQLNEKIVQAFPGLAVRKDLTKVVKGNAVVPSYVLEYLLGQYCATEDADSINSGIETVKNILEKHYVQREEAELIKTEIHRKGKHKVIDKVTVNFNESEGIHEAIFSNLGIKKVEIASDTVKKHPKLLVGGVWCIADVAYEISDNPRKAPWVIESLKPIQVSHVDFDQFIQARSQFSLDEWMDVLLQTMGLNPEQFGRRGKLLQLTRLIPFCERNYNLIELGPKGTGKSHIFSEFSPHGILISGGEVSVPKLFVSNHANGKIGLVGYWDVVAFDEFAGQAKKVDKSLVDIMKNYMANKTFSRGKESMGAEASMAFMGNTKHSVPHMLKHSDLFDELPANYHDSAFLDRFHYYLPGWEVDVLRNDMFTSGYGLIVDYLAEILKNLRSKDYSQSYRQFYTLSSEVSTRDQAAIVKTLSGLIKVLYPNDDCPKDVMLELMSYATEGRKRVKDQLLKIDPDSFTKVSFSFTDNATNQTHVVTTTEDRQYPELTGYAKIEDDNLDLKAEFKDSVVEGTVAKGTPVAKDIQLEENQKGLSYQKLFGAYCKNATQISISDPKLKSFLNVKHLSEFLHLLSKLAPLGEDLQVELQYCASEGLISTLEQLANSLTGSNINFSATEAQLNMEGATVSLNNGWVISLAGGLDIFKPYDANNPFAIEQNIQEARYLKAGRISFKKEG